MLTDDSWKLLSKIMHLTGRIYNKPEHRMPLEGILFRIRTGIPWRDLPRQFGEWNTVFRRFNLWSKKGVMMEIFQFLSRFNDPQWLFIDASIVSLSSINSVRQSICQSATTTAPILLCWSMKATVAKTVPTISLCSKPCPKLLTLVLRGRHC